MPDTTTAYRPPVLERTGRGYEVRLPGSGLASGYVERGPNMRGWGWTVGFGWHTGLATLGAALDALLADPAFGVDVHGEWWPSLVKPDGGAS
jgi:hypothetical protein